MRCRRWSHASAAGHGCAQLPSHWAPRAWSGAGAVAYTLPGTAPHTTTTSAAGTSTAAGRSTVVHTTSGGPGVAATTTSSATTSASAPAWRVPGRATQRRAAPDDRGNRRACRAPATPARPAPPARKRQPAGRPSARGSRSSSPTAACSPRHAGCWRPTSPPLTRPAAGSGRIRRLAALDLAMAGGPGVCSGNRAAAGSARPG